MSALGQERTCLGTDVRFTPKSGHSLERRACPRHVRDHGLVDFDPGCLDDSLPLLGICFQKLRELVRGGAFDGVCVTC